MTLETAIRQYIHASLAFGEVVADLLQRGGPDLLNAEGELVPLEVREQLQELDQALRWGRAASAEDVIAVVTAGGVT